MILRRKPFRWIERLVPQPSDAVDWALAMRLGFDRYLAYHCGATELAELDGDRISVIWLPNSRVPILIDPEPLVIVNPRALTKLSGVEF